MKLFRALIVFFIVIVCIKDVASKDNEMNQSTPIDMDDPILRDLAQTYTLYYDVELLHEISFRAELVDVIAATKLDLTPQHIHVSDLFPITYQEMTEIGVPDTGVLYQFSLLLKLEFVSDLYTAGREMLQTVSFRVHCRDYGPTNETECRVLSVGVSPRKLVYPEKDFAERIEDTILQQLSQNPRLETEFMEIQELPTAGTMIYTLFNADERTDNFAVLYKNDTAIRVLHIQLAADHPVQVMNVTATTHHVFPVVLLAVIAAVGLLSYFVYRKTTPRGYQQVIMGRVPTVVQAVGTHYTA